MVRLRAAKVEAIVQDVPDVVPAGDPDGRLLIVGWGSTYGAITAALQPERAQGPPHRPRPPAPPEPAAEEPRRGAEALPTRSWCPEMNMGQLVMVLRAKYLVDAQGYNKMQGKPFKQSEIEAKIEEIARLKPATELAHFRGRF